MSLSKSSADISIFDAINIIFTKYEISWNNCVSLGGDNTLVNVGRHNSLIVEARKQNDHINLMGCPCHISHNTAKKADIWFRKEVVKF